jgi:uncharacterized protein YbbC (DUF1343 family)
MKQLIFTIIFFSTIVSIGQKDHPVLVEYDEIVCGADRMPMFITQLLNKRVAIMANQSSIVGKNHLVDTLLTYDIHISKIFCPEHGFRGKADAGEKIDNDIDSKTGIPIISLYGSHKKPTPDDLQDIDIVIFDLQDVGTRFYTYISSMSYVMESCAENNIPIIVLDRPNPNGYYVDGPVMEEEYCSFVGMHPVPIVYGMTIGEYANMVVGEAWINCADSLDLEIIPMSNYTHNKIVKLKIAPSPNLPNWQSVYLYPSVCLFEGTVMSVGRGTDVPFQVYGHPDFMIGSITFTPGETIGASKPKYDSIACYGDNLVGYAQNYNMNDSKINLIWLIGAYNIMSQKGDFFTSYFEILGGNATLRKQIIDGLSEKEIRASWLPGIEEFKKTRSKYLIYP